MAQAFEGYYPVSSHTRWMELRDVVLALDVGDRPEFRPCCILNGHVSIWDGEWFYHSRTAVLQIWNGLNCAEAAWLMPPSSDGLRR